MAPNGGADARTRASPGILRALAWHCGRPGDEIVMRLALKV